MTAVARSARGKNRILLSREVLLSLIYGRSRAVSAVFASLLDQPSLLQPFLPYLTRRAVDDIAKLLRLPQGSDNLGNSVNPKVIEEWLISLETSFTILDVTRRHVQTAIALNWPEIERAIDYSVACANQLDAILFLDGTQLGLQLIFEEFNLEEWLNEEELQVVESDYEFVRIVLLSRAQKTFDFLHFLSETTSPNALSRKLLPPLSNEFKDILRGEPSIDSEVVIEGKSYPVRIYGTPLEVTLKVKEAERDQLKDELAKRLIELNEIKQQNQWVAAQFFQYMSECYVRLDNLKALLLREIYLTDPTIEEIAREEYERARRQLEEVYGEFYTQHYPHWCSWDVFICEAEIEDEVVDQEPPQVSDQASGQAVDRSRSKSLRDLKLRLVFKIHPDLVQSSAPQTEIDRRNEYMVRVNAAFDRGDVEELQMIEMEWDSNPGEAIHEKLRTQLRQILKYIQLLQQRIDQVIGDIRQKKSSRWYKNYKQLEKFKTASKAYLPFGWKMYNMSQNDLQLEDEVADLWYISLAYYWEFKTIAENYYAPDREAVEAEIEQVRADLDRRRRAGDRL